MPACLPGALQLRDLTLEAVEDLVQWALHQASPAQRGYLFTRVGRLPAPHPLGAALCTGLLEAGRPEDALRLVRHAGRVLTDAELAALARRHMVEGQVRAPGRRTVGPWQDACQRRSLS